MKIRTQIIFAQVPTAMIIVLITIFFILALTSIEYKSESILVDNFKNILSMQRLNDSVEELNRYIIHHPKLFDDKIKNMESNIEKELIFQEKAIRELGEEKDLAKSLREKWEFYKANIHSLSQTDATENTYRDLKLLSTNIIELNQDSIIQKKDDLSNFIREYRFFISFSSLISLVFGFFMSWIFTGLFLSPLNKMIEVVSQFGKTDETILLHIKGSEELEKLSNEFNLMTNRLEEYHQSTIGHVVENYETLKGASDAIPDPILIFNISNDIVFMNKSAFNIFSISGAIKKKNPIFCIENNLKERILELVKKVVLTKNTQVPKINEETITILNKNKKKLFLPFAYPIRNVNNINHTKITNVLVVLQDVTHHSLSEQTTGEVCRTFIHDYQAPLAEIQIGIYTISQESAGPLTEKQKEILYAVQDKCDELEDLYQEFFKVVKIDHKNE